MDLLFALILIFALQIFFFIFAAILRTDKVTDLAYGLSFVIVALWAAFTVNDAFTWIIALAITFWGLRLASFLLIRVIRLRSDKRFDGIRESFLRFGMFWFFQASIVFVILLPFLFVSQNGVLLRNLATLDVFGWMLFIIGLSVWLIGFVIEAVADWQKYQFKNKNPKKWTDVGLWKYARHPNYFGEMLCWWGLFVAMIPVLQGWQIIGAISPLAITGILLFGSGIPTVEKQHQKHYGKNKEYQQYRKRTNVLVPLPKRK